MIQLVFNNTQWNKSAAFYLRTIVFVNEQRISLKMEFDEHDSDETNYLVIYHDHSPIGTARYQQDDSKTLRPDRLCVHPRWRKQGIGRRLLLELEFIGKQNKCSISRIHAEKQALPFYKKLGYVPVSDEFIEDGIICIKVEKSLT